MKEIKKKFASSDDAYYSDFEYVTNSQLGLIKKSPEMYLHRKEQGESPMTQPMMFGDAFHKMILEPEKFADEFVISPNVDRRTKAGKQEYNEFIESIGDKKTVTAFEAQDLFLMKDKLAADNTAFNLLNSSGKNEAVEVWEHKLNDSVTIGCKGKFDYLHDDYIVDLKTTRDCSSEAFMESCEKYGYFRQAAFYVDSQETKKDFYFIAIEKKAPYFHRIYKVSEESLARGREEYKLLLYLYAKYVVVNKYDIHNTDICSI